jgi:excisionase family DNA binding protein
MRELLKIREVAELFGVRQPTVRRWLADGKLAFIRTPGGQIRVPAEAFVLQWERVVAGQGSE